MPLEISIAIHIFNGLFYIIYNILSFQWNPDKYVSYIGTESCIQIRHKF